MIKMQSVLRGRVHKFGDDINTDLISPAQYMAHGNDVIAAHALEGADPDFPRKMKAGDIVAAGKNFGSGSSRETAPIALKGIGVAAVVAEFFARIFYRNCINIGLPAIICPEAGKIRDGDELEIRFEEGAVVNATTGERYECAPLSPNIMEIVRDGGLLEHVEKTAAPTGRRL